MNPEQIMEILRARIQGKPIQYRCPNTCNVWIGADDDELLSIYPGTNREYRIKPKEPREFIIFQSKTSPDIAAITPVKNGAAGAMVMVPHGWDVKNMDSPIHVREVLPE